MWIRLNLRFGEYGGVQLTVRNTEILATAG